MKLSHFTKRISALLLILALLLSVCPTALALEPTLDDRASFVGGVYDELRAPSEGFCAYRSGDLWGFVDISDGSIAIPAAYPEVRDFSDGYAAVRTDAGTYTFINRFGAQLGGRWYGVGRRSDGLVAVRDYFGSWGYLNSDFSLLVPCGFRAARDFSDGFAAVCDADGWFFIDERGGELTRDRYLEVGDFSGSFAPVRAASGWGVLDSEGVLVDDCEWLRAIVSDGVCSLVGGDGCAFVSADERVRHYQGYSDLGAFSEGLAPVKVKDRWGFAEQSGELAIPALYDEVGGFSHGLAYAVRAGVPGVLNRGGGFTSLAGSTDYSDFTGTAAPVRFGSGWALFRADLSYAALRLGAVAGGDGDRFAVRTDDGWRVLAANSAGRSSAQFPNASSWAVAELRSAGALGMLDPLEDLGSWSANITRQRVCELTLRFYELVGGEIPEVDYSLFTDTRDLSVLRSAAVGLVSGDGNGRFRPNDPLTREEAAAILCRLCKLIGFAPDEVRTDEPSDISSVSGWARDYVLTLYRAEVFRGNERRAFEPASRLSAEASALTLYRLLYAPGELN